MARILIVDDEPRIVSFVGRALTAEGYGVDSAGDGEHAIRMCRTGIFDLVMLDLRLPDARGTDILQTVVALDPNQSVVVVSEISDTTEKVRCFALGACDYVTKPFALDELVARVAARLRDRSRSAAEPPARPSRGPVRLDVKKRTADAGRGPVHLSEREFRVLDFLVQRLGEVCTREAILADVWGYWYDPGSNMIDVIIGRLRHKIGVDVIETVRNVGYAIGRE
jgi:DNA-binding response OmpR family regulator